MIEKRTQIYQIDTDEPTEKHKKLLQNLEEFETYIRL
jgi:hypothetical protein